MPHHGNSDRFDLPEHLRSYVGRTKLVIEHVQVLIKNHFHGRIECRFTRLVYCNDDRDLLFYGNLFFQNAVLVKAVRFTGKVVDDLDAAIELANAKESFRDYYESKTKPA